MLILQAEEEEERILIPFCPSYLPIAEIISFPCADKLYKK